MKGFNSDKYLGKWYEIAKIPSGYSWDLGCKNSSAKYSADFTNPTAILVKNKCYDKSGKLLRQVYGRARLAGEDKSKFLIEFLGDYPVPEGIRKGEGCRMEGNYWVLSTNYSSYSFVSNGDNLLWILSRQKQVPASHIPALLKEVKKLGFDPEKVITNSSKFLG